MENSRPGTIREGYLGTGSGINENPRLALPTRNSIHIYGIKMPASADYPVTVTVAAGLSHRKRQDGFNVRRNLITFLIKQPNNMDGRALRDFFGIDTSAGCLNPEYFIGLFHNLEWAHRKKEFQD